MKKILFLITLLIVSASAVHATLQQAGPQYTAADKFWAFAINAVDNKIYLATTGAGNNIVVLDLVPDSGILGNGGSPIQMVSCTTPATMALDAMKRKLYCGSGNGIYIFNISDTGLLVGPPVPYSHAWSDGSVSNLLYSPVYNMLYSSGVGWSANGFVVSHLGADGTPDSATGIPAPVGLGSCFGAVLDEVRNQIYMAHNNGNEGTDTTYKRIQVTDTGFPIPATYVAKTGGGMGPLLDSANKRVYCFIQNNAYIQNLNNNGIEESVDAVYLNYLGVSALNLPRKRMFSVLNTPVPSYLHIGYYNLDANGRPNTLVDSAVNSTAGNWHPTWYTVAYEPFYNKLYILDYDNANYLCVYSCPDSPLVPVQINNGETLTETPYVTLKFQHSNPHYIYVSGNLLSIDNPIANLNQWKSCGGTMWRNSGENATAETLTVSAVLSSGLGEKTVEVWYISGMSSGWNGGATNAGMMKKATVKITLIESNARVTAMAISRIDYSGARIDYTVVDGRDRNVSMTIQYKTSAHDWTNATIASGSEGTTGLTATLAGVSHYFLWDIEKDLPENAKEVQVRIRADNGDSAGVYLESEKYSVPDWTGSDIKVTNASVKKPDGSWMFRVRLEWTGVADTTTTYEIQKKEDGGSWTFVTSMTGTLIEIENLSDTPVYSFKARLRTKEGLFSAYSKNANIRLTRRSYGTAVVGKTGGSVFIEDYDENDANNSRVEVSEGTFREDVTIMLERFNEGEYEINGKKQNNAGLSEIDFKKPVTIKLGYDREKIQGKGWLEDDLAIYHFDGMNWNSIAGTVDKTNCLVTANVNHFSKFKISVNYAKPEISVIPDYLTPNGDGIADVLHFYFSTQNLLEKAEIKIYDVNGRVMRVIRTGITSNTPYWDGRTEDGVLCEAGLYICVIESDAKRLVKTVQLVK